MLSFPEGRTSQWKAPSVGKNLSGQRKVAASAYTKNYFDEERNLLRMLRMKKLFVPLATLLALAAPSHAQTKAKPAETGMTPLERRASLNLEAARSNPLQLRNLLFKMPKGADLHNHLSGAVYAESWIRAAADDHLCLDPSALQGTKSVFSKPESQNSSPACGNGKIPAADIYNDQVLYDDLIDSFSMRGFVPSPGVTGHDQFFRTFARFGGTSHHHLGEWLDEAAARAGSQNEQYLELMHTPEFDHAAKAGYEIGWQDDLAHFRDALLAKGFGTDISAAKEAMDEAEALRAKREHCGQPDESAGCRVQLRYLCQVLRGFPKQQVFAQTIFCFELAMADPRFVGVNMVMPEDGYNSMNDYAVQMQMVKFLHPLYPKVHISLHAGEIAPGLVPYEGLCCHVRLAVEQASAERIGHGVDVMYEERPHELLKEMAAKHVMVEISLSSNDLILGIAGKDHPFPLYRQFGVPVALASDDEGVSRIDLTHEYVRVVQTYDLHYRDLKQMVRTSVEHAFLPGASLWAAPDKFTSTVSACSHDQPGAEKPSASCASFLKSSEKAHQQWELEKRFHVFESTL
jgi:adenosine deaminase